MFIGSIVENQVCLHEAICLRAIRMMELLKGPIELRRLGISQEVHFGKKQEAEIEVDCAGLMHKNKRTRRTL